MVDDKLVKAAIKEGGKKVRSSSRRHSAPTSNAPPRCHRMASAA
jgi:hypothetical protein